MKRPRVVRASALAATGQKGDLVLAICRELGAKVYLSGKTGATYLDRGTFSVPECQTRVDLFPEFRDGKMYYYADLNVRQSPTIAAFLAILFSAINGQPPSTVVAIPDDFVRQVMDGIGLAGREVGLTAMLLRVKRYAQQAATAAA